MLELLFDTPWWLPTALICIGLFVFYTGNQRQEKPVMRGGVVIVLLGLLVILVSSLVETDREAVVTRTQNLVADAGKQDWQAFAALVDPQTSIYGLRGPDEIRKTFQAAAQRVQLTSARITGWKIDQAPSVINVSIRVLSEQLGRTAASDWQFQYQRTGQKWILFNVRVLPNDQFSDDAIKAALSRSR